MQFPRKHYREIARNLVEEPTPENIQEAVKAINSLLDERASLVKKILERSKDTTEANKKPNKKKTFLDKLLGS